MGEQELATEMDFSRVGRVNAMLARRLELLAEVQHHRLTNLLQDVHLTCSMMQNDFACQTSMSSMLCWVVVRQQTEVKLFLVLHAAQVA